MSGAFGLLGDPHPSHFPLDRLVENWARLDAHKLNRIGAFAEGTITRLAWGEKTLPPRQTRTEHFDQREPRYGGVGRAGAAVV